MKGTQPWRSSASGGGRAVKGIPREQRPLPEAPGETSQGYGVRPGAGSVISVVEGPLWEGDTGTNLVGGGAGGSVLQWKPPKNQRPAGAGRVAG